MLPLSSTSSLTFFIAGPGLRSSEREEAGGGSLASDQMDASWMDDPDSCLDSLFSARNKAALRCEDVPNFFPLRFFPPHFFPAEIVMGVALITPFGVYVSCYRSRSRVKTDVTAIIGCEGGPCHGGGASTDPWLCFLLSPLVLRPALPPPCSISATLTVSSSSTWNICNR